MTHRLAMIRPATAAFAVVLALSSTPLLAQDVPDATQPAAETPVTAVPEIDPAAATPSEPTATSVPLAPIAEPVTAKPRNSTTVRRAASVARPASAAAAPAPAAAPAAAPAPTVDAAPIAVAAVPAAPAAAVVATRPAEEVSVASGAMLPIVAAVGLGLLGLVVVGVAVRRRRRRNEEELAAADYYEPAVEAPAPALETEAAPAFVDPLVAELPPEPAAPPPAIVAGAAPAAELAPAASDCVDAAPGSHVEAACEGPTADNPSLSIKKRLKRARFFDQREFLAEAGEVAPMAADAGLPDAVEVPADADTERV